MANEAPSLDIYTELCKSDMKESVLVQCYGTVLTELSMHGRVEI